METKNTYALVRQILTQENGWYSDVKGTFPTLDAAESELANHIEYIKQEDPRIAVRELSWFNPRMCKRVGWISNDYTFPMGQMIIIEI